LVSVHLPPFFPSAALKVLIYQSVNCALSPCRLKKPGAGERIQVLKQTAITMTVAGGAVVTVPVISSTLSVKQTRQEYLEEHSIRVDISGICQVV